MTDEWIEFIRKGGETPDARPLVSIRRSAIAFNAQFVAKAAIDGRSRVSIFTKPKSFKIGFKFHNDNTKDNSLALTRDGGGRGRGRGRSIETAALMRENSWLAAVSLEPDQALRRFEPEWDSVNSLWSISIRPTFEIRVSNKSDIHSDVCGIYRYKRGDEIMYIGRGQVKSRAQSFGRDKWDFEAIEYSVVLGEAEQKKWEAFWLDHFFKQHGKLPIYNRIAGEISETE